MGVVPRVIADFCDVFPFIMVAIITFKASFAHRTFALNKLSMPLNASLILNCTLYVGGSRTCKISCDLLAKIWAGKHISDFRHLVTCMQNSQDSMLLRQCAVQGIARHGRTLLSLWYFKIGKGHNESSLGQQTLHSQ